MRARLIDVCSRTGGHIGAGLGVVELTIALHYVFDTPRDQLVWDVGHQGYPHKILTGRNDRLETLRQEGGLSGFLKRTESEYDAFGAGHAATAISAALGMAAGRDLKRREVQGRRGPRRRRADVRARLRRAQQRRRTRTATSSSCSTTTRCRSRRTSARCRSTSTRSSAIRSTTACASKIGEHRRRRARAAVAGAARIVRKWEESVKAFLTPGVLFEELGFRYFGPIDGHDIDALVDTFGAVREMTRPAARARHHAEGEGIPGRRARRGEKWHALPPGHDPATGKQLQGRRRRIRNYTKVFGEGLAELGDREREASSRITAAMPSGTGTGAFAKAHPKRFFDVGIAEGHAVTFAAGLATRGVRPVVAIYSTFLQRAYDNIIHDVAIQHLPVVFCMDRAGLVGEDGETHMGLYDIAYMLAVPGHDGHRAEGRRRDAGAAAHGARARRRPVLPCAIRATSCPTPVPPHGGHRAPCRTARGKSLRARRSRGRDPRRRHDGAARAARRPSRWRPKGSTSPS